MSTHSQKNSPQSNEVKYVIYLLPGKFLSLTFFRPNATTTNQSRNQILFVKEQHQHEQHAAQRPDSPQTDNRDGPHGTIQGSKDIESRADNAEPQELRRSAQADGPGIPHHHGQGQSRDRAKPDVQIVEQSMIQTAIQHGWQFQPNGPTGYIAHRLFQPSSAQQPVEESRSKSKYEVQHQRHDQSQKGPRVDSRGGPPRVHFGKFDSRQDAQVPSRSVPLQFLPPRSDMQQNILPRLLPQARNGSQPLFPSQYDTSRNQPRNLMYPDRASTSNLMTHQQSQNKAKMMKGQTYDPSDPELVYDRTRCRTMLSRLNSGDNPTAESRRLLARTFLGIVGDGVEIESPFRCEYGYNIQVGEGTFIGPDCIIEDPSLVSIGSKCVIGPRVTICCKRSSTNLNDHNGSRSLFYAPGVWIEDRVCIEAGVVIHPGVTIGKGSTILAGSVVTKVSAFCTE